MANQVAGSQTKLAADVTQLKTDVESLNSNLTQRTFNLVGYQDTSNYTFTLPEAPQAGHSYYIILCHFASSTSIAVDTIYLSFSSATTTRSAWITHNSSASITGVSVSGHTVTITFGARAYVSASFIKCF